MKENITALEERRSSLPTHTPVMLKEVVEYLSPERGNIIVDGTCGLGGHTRELCKYIKPDGMLFAFDVDREVLNYARENLEEDNVIFLRSHFAELDTALNLLGIKEVDKILFDLGLSSYHLEGSGRGFSFQKNEVLDMRFDTSVGKPAHYYIKKLREEELTLILRHYGEERFAQKIAKGISLYRERFPIETTSALNQIIEEAVPLPYLPRTKARVYMALRILVNDELRGLVHGIMAVSRVLKKGGRVAIISYHSLEDRIVKYAGKLTGFSSITKKPLVPTPVEIKGNKRARSAKLRILEKTGDVREEAVMELLGLIYFPLHLNSRKHYRN